LISKVERPKITSGPTIREATGCGNLYVRIMSIPDERNPVEVFASLGKTGSCTGCQLEALTRSITLGLKYGVPIQEYVNELKGLRCPSPYMWPEEERTLSCPDAVSRALKEYCENCKV
jgi:ribonucleoside-diphosphate reductase alpha chain